MRAAHFALAAIILLASSPVLAQTTADPPDVVFTPAITAKVAELASDPVRIYEFVRNELSYELYFGMMKGPEGTLLSGGGNDYDLAALLVSMYRSAGVPARFVRRRIRVPFAEAAAWTGAMDGAGALELLKALEPPAWACQPMETGPCETEGASETLTGFIDLWHVWVEAKLPVAHYRGAGGATGGEAWIPLDPSFKLREPQGGIVLPIGSDPLLTMNYSGDAGLYGDVHARDPVEIFEGLLRSYLASNHPGKSLSDIPPYGNVVPAAPGLLPTAPPFEVLESIDFEDSAARGAALSSLHPTSQPDYRYRWAFYLCNDSLDPDECEAAGLLSLDGDPGNDDPDLRLSHADFSPALEGKRVSLTFIPVPGYVPIVIGELIIPFNCFSSFSGQPPFDPWPVEARLFVDGTQTGLLEGLDVCEPFLAVVATYPPQDAFAGADAPILSDHRITAIGVHTAILDAHTGSPQQTARIGDALAATQAPGTPGAFYPIAVDPVNLHPFVDDNPTDGVFQPFGEDWLVNHPEALDAVVGGVLHFAGARYIARTREDQAHLATYHHKLLARFPATGLLRAGSRADYIFDVPVGIRPLGLLLDVKGQFEANLDLDGTIPANVIDHYAELLGHAGSHSEHATWEEIGAFEAISTVRGFQLTGASGDELLSILDSTDADAATASCSLDVTFNFNGSGSSFTLAGIGTVNGPFPTAWTFDTGDPSGSLKNRLEGTSVTATGGDCTDIDASTYCVIKQFFGADHIWRAPVWDARFCPTPVGASPPSTSELRVAPRSGFRYRDWDGNVFFANFDGGSTTSLVFGIQQEPNEAFGGSYQAGDSFYNDPLSITLGNPTALGFPDISVGEALPDSLDPLGEAAALAAAYDRHVALDTTISQPSVDDDSTAGDPVSIVNGNFHHVVTDLTIAGRGGFDLQLVRSYNSRQGYSGSLGYGWMHTYEQHIRVEPGDAGVEDDRVVFVSDRGVESIFYDKPTGFATDGWVSDQLVRNGDQSFTLTRKNGHVLQFHPPSSEIAHLDYLEDRNGNRITVDYPSGIPGPEIDGVLDAAGQRLEFEYTGAHLSKITDWTGREWRYTVDVAGDLVEYFDPVQVETSGEPVRYQYISDPGGTLDHNIERLTMPADRDGMPGGDWTLDFDYWSDDRVRSHINALGETTSFDYNLLQRRTLVTEPDGSVTNYLYDRYGNRTRVETGRGTVREFAYARGSNYRTSAIDGLGFEQRMIPDSRGNVLHHTDRTGAVSSATYNEFSQPLTRIDRRGHQRRWDYDANGNHLREYAELDGDLQLLSEHRYDGFGNRIESCAFSGPTGPGRACTRFEYATNGVGVKAIIDPEGRRTRFTLDALGRPTSTERERFIEGQLEPDRILTETIWDARDRVVVTIDAAGTRSETDYDANGLVIETRTVAFSGSRTDSKQTYDGADRLIASENALGDVETFEYDSRGRLVRQTSPLGNESRFEYDLDGNATAQIDPTGAAVRTEYDAENRPVRVTDPVGRSIVRSYDAEGRVTRIDQEVGGAVLRTLTRAVYDAEGNPIQEFDPEDHETERVFDALGRPTQVTFPKDVPAEAATTGFSYDLQGRVVSRMDANQHEVKLAYDLLGRLIETENALGHKARREYDELGDIVRTVDADGREVQYKYDTRGLLLQRSGDQVDADYAYDAFGRQTLASVPTGVMLTAEYDDLDRAVVVRSSAAGTARRVFDGDGRVVQAVYPTGGPFGLSETAVVNYAYDARSQIASVRDPQAGEWRFAYDSAGRLTRREIPSGFASEIEYTPEGFTDRIDLLEPGNPIPVSFSAYDDYDARGHPDTLTTEEGVTSVAYDARGQVVSVLYPTSESESFSYDLVGNRTGHTARDGVARVYVHDAGDRLERIEDDLPQPTTLTTFSYDDAGRRTLRADIAGETTSYTYDALGRLNGLTRTGGGLYFAILGYDATGNRTSAADVHGDTLDAFGEWVEHHSGTAVRLIHGGGLDHILAELTGSPSAPGDVRSLFPDASNNVGPVVIDGTLEPSTRRYETFGAIRSGSSIVTRSFAGRPYDLDTGLVYMRARHYDPSTGQFLQSDPLGVAAVHPYAYANNNPYSFSDPLGLEPAANGSRLGSQVGLSASSHRNLDATLFSFAPLFRRALGGSRAVEFAAGCGGNAGCLSVAASMQQTVRNRSNFFSAVTFGLLAVAPLAGELGAARSGLAAPATRGAPTLRRFVRQSEFDRIQKAIGTGGDARLGRFFTPDNISNPRVAASQLGLPGTGRNPIAGFVDVPRSALPSQPLTAFGPRLTQPFTGRDLVRLPGGGLEVEFAIDPVVRGSALRLVPTP